MIIFDLDGVLADFEHRKHFVDPKKNPDYEQIGYYGENALHNYGWYHKNIILPDPPRRKEFKQDWEAFSEACDWDVPISAVIEVLHAFSACERNVQIWTGRCESVRDKTVDWLYENANMKYVTSFDFDKHLKMRPIGDETPDDVLKERWLDEYMGSLWPPLTSDFKDGEVLHRKDPIQFVFDDHPKSVKMWKRRGIFVFDCNQEY